ncbi:EVE domain-containing protein [Lunatimonas salinarum]|uniref:EVE domain-containing protein n=1 Tax=Lunatimonas salinarum TaxID=1774590 RepID=UPI001AE025C4|nr:EVE domain-containing protein [Lunatimonas salinarum]
MNYWLVKTEPESYSLGDLERKGEDCWDGVRNHQARNFMAKMNPGDLVFVYHSGKQKALVGMAKVISEPYSDPKAEEGEKWLAVDLRFETNLPKHVGLAAIKAADSLQDLLLIRQSRLSVMPITSSEAETLLKMANS